MLIELTDELLLIAAIACGLGVIIAALIFTIGHNSRANKEDPRDSRIRSLEAELRVAQNDRSDNRSETDRLQDELKETVVGLEKRDNVITEQQNKLQKVMAELKESVVTQQRLRTELAARAAEGLNAEARIREVQTELSVARASNDMIATGALDYELSPKSQSPEDHPQVEDETPAAASKGRR